MVEFVLSLFVGAGYAWGVDILFTPGLSHTLGIILIIVMMALQITSLPAINQIYKDYRKVVEFQSVIIIGATFPMFLFFLDKYSDLGSNYDDWQYIAPMVATGFGSIISLLCMLIVRKA